MSLFVFFNVFALNHWLQYRAKGRWQNYLFGEKVYEQQPYEVLEK